MISEMMVKLLKRRHHHCGTDWNIAHLLLLSPCLLSYWSTLLFLLFLPYVALSVEPPKTVYAISACSLLRASHSERVGAGDWLAGWAGGWVGE